MPRASLRRRFLWTVLGVVYLYAFATAGSDIARVPPGQGAWPSNGADRANSKYAPLDQINQDNVTQLQVIWRWRSVENTLLQDRPYLWTMVNVTGAPVWPMEERPVPQSWVSGEKTSRTQLFPTRPLPFERQGITRDDVLDLTPD